MNKWNYKEVTFDDCLTVSDAIEKYLVLKENTPSEFLPCLDWWFLSHIYDNISYDLYDNQLIGNKVLKKFHVKLTLK